MRDRLFDTIYDLQMDTDLAFLSESGVRQSIRQVLKALGWNADDRHEVCDEYSVKDGKVDYALLIADVPRVFIEAKKGGNLLKKDQQQIIDYARDATIGLAVLTNGLKWWFYSPLHHGDLEQLKFATLHLDKQQVIEIGTKLIDLLSKKNVDSGESFYIAESLYESKRKDAKISEILPKVWNELWKEVLSEPDGWIADRFLHKAQQLCEEVDISQVVKFMRNQALISQPDSVDADSENHAKPKEFTFNGRRYGFRSIPHYLVVFCEALHENLGDRFEEVLRADIGQRRYYFSKNMRDLDRPEPIGGTGIFVHTNFTSDEIKNRVVPRLAKYFKYDPPVLE